MVLELVLVLSFHQEATSTFISQLSCKSGNLCKSLSKEYIFNNEVPRTIKGLLWIFVIRILLLSNIHSTISSVILETLTTQCSRPEIKK